MLTLTTYILLAEKQVNPHISEAELNNFIPSQQFDYQNYHYFSVHQVLSKFLSAIAMQAIIHWKIYCIIMAAN